LLRSFPVICFSIVLSSGYFVLFVVLFGTFPCDALALYRFLRCSMHIML